MDMIKVFLAEDEALLRRGLRIGISDYLLKPVTSQKLLEALRKVAQSIQEEREKNRLLERYACSFASTRWAASSSRRRASRQLSNRRCHPR